MTELCTAGYSEAGEVAAPFRDCRQEAVDSGNCGTHEMCVECENWWDWAEGKYWANVGYEACPDWVVDAINAEGATGGQCADWVRDGVFVDNIACGETRYESTANAAHWLSGNDAPDHFYVITPAETAYYHFSTCGSDYDTMLYLYDVVDYEADTCLRSPAPHAGAVSLIGEWDDPGKEECTSTGSRDNLEDVWTSQPLQAGETYVLQVTGFSDREECDTDHARDAGAAGNYVLTVGCGSEPDNWRSANGCRQDYCTDDNNDCYASMDWGEPATCSNGYFPSPPNPPEHDSEYTCCPSATSYRSGSCGDHAWGADRDGYSKCASVGREPYPEGDAALHAMGDDAETCCPGGMYPSPAPTITAAPTVTAIPTAAEHWRTGPAGACDADDEHWLGYMPSREACIDCLLYTSPSPRD